MIIKIFASVGLFVTAWIVWDIVELLYEKIKRWRRNNCKIRFLCNPHVYEMEYRWPQSGETCLICKKCGKKKKIIISPEIDSVKFNEIFRGKNDKTN